jgi:UDP-3-O-[3-hydroxymyristoyl] glucosamine N-acyltransferase
MTGGAGPRLVTAGAIAAAVGGVLNGPPSVPVVGLAAIDQAVQPTEAGGSLTFIRSAKFAAQWEGSRAVAALVSRGVEVPGHDPTRRALITVENADVAMAQVLGMFAPKVHGPAAGVHPTAVVDPTAHLGQGVSIGAMCVVGPRTRIGDGCVIHPRVTLGAEVSIGPLTTLHPGVVVYDRCTIGTKCILHGNVVIGADGFGYVPDPQGRGLIKLPHIGTVEIGNAVEIGACTCVDRGKFGATTVGDMSKIDNLVQVGHNVRIGRACIICGGCAIGGSAVLDDGVILAGQVGVRDGKRIGARAVISGGSGVMDDVPPGEVWFGTPAAPHKDQMRSFVALRHLSDHMRELRRASKQARKVKDSDRPKGLESGGA